MKIYNSIPEDGFNFDSVITVGNFDGLHLAHVSILEKLKSYQSQYQAETVVISFPTNPRNVLQPSHFEHLNIQTSEEKLESLTALGINHAILITNFYDFFNIEAHEFVTTVLFKKLRAKAIVIGFNHRFGKNKAGDIHLLESLCNDYNVALHIVKPFEINNQIISSSNIRKLILNNNLELANRLLGRHFSFKGRVVEGQKLGRTLGFPTANILILDYEKLIPANGVYVVQVTIQNNPKNVLQGMMNIGFRPTFNSYDRTIEVHIFNFDQTIYDEIIKIDVCAFIRHEKKFNNIEALKKQLQLDKNTCLSNFTTQQ